MGVVYGGTQKNTHSQLIQNRAMRYYLGVHNFTPIPALEGEMGWMPSKFIKYLNIARLWNKIIKMSNDRLPMKIFEYIYASGFNPWCRKVKEICQLIDKEEIYENKLPFDIENLKENLEPIIESGWKKQLNNKPKFRTYQLYKECFQTSYFLLNECD